MVAYVILREIDEHLWGYLCSPFPLRINDPFVAFQLVQNIQIASDIEKGKNSSAENEESDILHFAYSWSEMSLRDSLTAF